MIKRSYRRTLFGVAAGSFAGCSTVALFGLTASRFQHTLQLGPVALGFLIAAPALAGCLLWTPFSVWAASGGGRKPFLVLLALSASGLAGLSLPLAYLYPLAPNRVLYPALFAAALLCGAGIATFPVGVHQVSFWIPRQELGRSSALLAGVTSGAPAAIYLIWPTLFARVGLSVSYAVWFGVVAAGGLVYLLFGAEALYFSLRSRGVPLEDARGIAREEGQERFPAGSGLDDVGAAGRSWRTWATAVVFFTSYGGFLALIMWFPMFWHSYFETSEFAAAALTAFCSLASSVTTFAVRLLCERLSDAARNVVIVSLINMSVGALLLVSPHEIEIAIGGATLLSIGMGACSAGVCKSLQASRQAMSSAAVRVGALGAFGGFAIPPVLGLAVMEFGRQGFVIGFLVFVFLSLLSLSAAWMLKYGKDKPGAIVIFGKGHFSPAAKR